MKRHIISLGFACGLILFSSSHGLAAKSEPQDVSRAMSLAKEWLSRFQTGNIDRLQLEPSVSHELTDAVVRREQKILKPFGRATAIKFLGSDHVDHATGYTFGITFASGKVVESIALDREGKIAGINFQTFPESN